MNDFITLGRDPSCHVPINDGFVSARHARIEKKVGGYVVRDLQSRNGTFLNGSRVTEAILSVNDRLRLGESVFVFAESINEKYELSSKNDAWSDQLKRLPTFASTDYAVLITGPSGSGKEILAQTIHRQSARARAPFISLNCSALSETLIESELFGHVRGSYTGAVIDRKGAFEAARTGTLFLDEIGDLPLSLQPKLLRALENNEIRPVGSDRTIETDVRIIAATHKKLPQAIAEGRFREDLYYRLNVCQLRTPDLVERMEDFDDLLYSFAKAFRVRFSVPAIDKMREHRWPGNIRELKNTVARASAYFPGKHIQPEDVLEIIETPLQSVENSSTPALMPFVDQIAKLVGSNSGTNGSVIREIERDMIITRLIANRGNQRKTAQDLGIPKSTLHDRIRSYQISLDLEETANV